MDPGYRQPCHHLQLIGNITKIYPVSSYLHAYTSNFAYNCWNSLKAAAVGDPSDNGWTNLLVFSLPMLGAFSGRENGRKRGNVSGTPGPRAVGGGVGLTEKLPGWSWSGMSLSSDTVAALERNILC